MYRVGFPGWKLAARFGLPMALRVDVRYDAEAKRYWATSPHLDGLAVEAPSLDELYKEVLAAVEALFEFNLHNNILPTTEYRFRDATLIAA